MRLNWARRAIRDLEALQAYVAQDKPSAAREQGVLVLSAVNQLQAFPGSGRKGRLAGTRELVVPGTPFIVAYRLRQDTIEVLAVVHGRRRWPGGF